MCGMAIGRLFEGVRVWLGERRCGGWCVTRRLFGLCFVVCKRVRA